MREALKLLSEIKEEVSELDKGLKAIAEQIALYDKTCLGDIEPVTTVTSSQPVSLSDFKMSPKEELAVLTAKSWPVEIPGGRLDLINLARKKGLVYTIIPQQAAGK